MNFSNLQENLQKNLQGKLKEKVLALKKHPKLSVIGIGSLCFAAWWAIAPNKDIQQVAKPLALQKPVISSVQEAIDPRALWADKISDQLKNLSQKIDEKEQKFQQDLETKLQNLDEKLEQKIQAIEQESQAKANVRALPKIQEQVEGPSLLSSRFAAKLSPKPIPKLIHLHQDSSDNSKKTQDYVAAGAFARAVLLTGVVADTGVSTSAEPQPILLRLVDHGIFSKGFKIDQLKDAVLIGSCYGQISSERANCRLESVSLTSKDGQIIERKVEGWLIGEDGRPGIKGLVVDKASKVARAAMLNGILGGISSFFQNQASSGIYPISPITGQTNALTGGKALQAGASQGSSNALNKLADYAIKRAESMNPVIVIGAGRVIDVVFKKGFHIKDEPTKALKVADTFGVKPDKGVKADNFFNDDDNQNRLADMEQEGVF
jgi:conjugal transfer pilus assembly protein TraB